MPHAHDAAAHPIRIRPAPAVGASLDCLFLGKVRGLMMHFVKDGHRKKPRHCPGRVDCPAKYHQLGAHWKGYAPAYVFDDNGVQKWIKCVVEVTPYLWETLKGLDLRGKHFSLFRQVDDLDHRPVCGVLIGEWKHGPIPEAFDIYPVLVRAYAGAEVKLDIPCPLPDTLVAMPLDAPPPAGKDNEKRELVEKVAEQAEHLRRLAELEERAKTDPFTRRALERLKASGKLEEV